MAKSREQIIAKLLSKRTAFDYGASPEVFVAATGTKSDLISASDKDIEIKIGKSNLLSLAIIQSGDEQYLIRIYLQKENEPKLTILYDQSQFSNLDRVAYRLCNSGIYLYG